MPGRWLIYLRNGAQIIKMAISKRFKYTFSLLSSVIKETIFKERLWNDTHQGEDQGSVYGGAELPGLSLPT